MDKIDFQKRTKYFAINVIRFTKLLPERVIESDVFKRQIIRSASSTAANYRASCRAKSQKDFISKMTIVEEECDETLFWLEMIEECELVKSDVISSLKSEANEILSMVVASIITSKKRLYGSKS
jgi:four helix bundle protein